MQFTPINTIIEWLKSKLNKKQFLLFSSVLVGLSVSLAAIVLKTFAHYIFLFSGYISAGNYKYVPLILPFIGILLTVLAVKYLLRGKIEKGIWNIHFALAKKSGDVPKEQMYAQILTSSLTVGFGGSAGLEAPIVITGAAFGSNYSKTYKLEKKEKTLLLACGVAAGIASVFNAPIAGVLFALEVLIIDISISAFTPLILSAATGALISKIFLEDDVLLSFQLQQPFNYLNLPFYVLMGILAGFISIYHSRTFTKIEGMFSDSPKKRYFNVLIGGLGIALLLLVFPSLFGEGYQSIKILSTLKPEKLLENSIFQSQQTNKWFVLMFIGAIIFIKSIATGLTIGSGGNGGNFAPSLFVGSYLGFFYSRCVNMLNIGNLPESNFTIVGMAGVLSGLYHAPLTAIFLIAEITGGYTLIIPLMIVSSISFGISKYFEPYTMDTKKLSKTGSHFTSDRDHNILTTLNTQALVEENFIKISPDTKLSDIVLIISQSQRNIFPVVKITNELVGIITLDKIKEVLFKTELHETLTAKELMTAPPAIINLSDSMEIVMNKFDETGAWNLPVIQNEMYYGFISKSTIFSHYRLKIKEDTLE